MVQYSSLFTVVAWCSVGMEVDILTRTLHYDHNIHCVEAVVVFCCDCVFASLEQGKVACVLVYIQDCVAALYMSH